MCKARNMRHLLMRWGRRLVAPWAAFALLGAAPSPDRVAFPRSIHSVSSVGALSSREPFVTRTSLLAEENAATMSFEVALRMRNFDELQARVARGEQIGRAEMQAAYYPLAADHDRVVAWIRAQGLEVTRTDDNHLAVFGRGTVEAVARAFDVRFARVTGANGGEFTSAVTAPSLPPDMAVSVLGIHGLQPHIRPRPLSTPRALPNLPATGSSTNGYLPSQVATAYNASGVSQTGAGQTIAIYALAYPKTTDLTAFWGAAAVSQTASNVTQVDIAGGPASSPTAGFVQEASLDVEWAGALAPGATLRVYGANENDPANNDEILQQVYADLTTYTGMHVLNICIGGNELDVPADYLLIEAQYMANLAVSGVTVLSASGDTGAYANGIVQTSYPTSDPDVTGVGGTTLMLTASGAVTSEQAWNLGGGGVSKIFAKPSWQTGGSLLAGQSMRCVPDIAAIANPNDGALYYYNGTPSMIGGTSLATPVWAAFCALIDQELATAGKQPLGLLNPKLYPLAGSAALRDITSGSNGYYSATTGYDLCTGLGVPNVASLLAEPFTSAASLYVPGAVGDEFATVGQPATFFAVAYGTAPITYQWQRMPAGSSAWTNLSDGGAYSGSATSTLVVGSATLAMSGDQFQCVASNASGSATSAPSSLTVDASGVTTFAGWPGDAGAKDGLGWMARLSEPGSVRADAGGNVYVSDSYNNTIRKVTPAGQVTTVAGLAGQSGSADGPLGTNRINGPGGAAIDAAGNLYIADDGNRLIRKVAANGTMTTLAGSGTQATTNGTGTAASFYDPQNLALDSAGNLYVADGMGNTIRMVTPAGVVTTFAGSGTAGSADGLGTAADFNDPTGIAVDASGNVYVADHGNNTVRVITPSGSVSTLAGRPGASGFLDGVGGEFNGPSGVGVDASGNVYVADGSNNAIRVVSPGGFVATVAGSPSDANNVDGPLASARFYSPGDVTVDASGIVYVADSLDATVRRIITAPVIAQGPPSQTVNPGSTVQLSVVAFGTGTLSYQWLSNGSPIAGATSATYTLANAQQAQAGTYAVTVTNSVGSATSTNATLAITAPVGSPTITVQPQAAVLQNGSATLSVTATGSGLAYQWYLNGSAIAGATSPTYTATAAGDYSVTVSNSVASVTSASVLVGSGSRLINVSSRELVGTGGSIAIAGFVVEGSAGLTKQVLIRGIGPGLSQFGVGGVLAQPTIALINATSSVVASNTGWSTGSQASQIATVASQVGAFALAQGSADSALLATVAPGAYTVQLSGVGSSTGIGLVEVYEVNTSDPTLLANISTRAQVGTGGNILIGGFVVGGSQSATVLIRGVGPTLGTAFGVSGSLQQPTLQVYNSANAVIYSNTGWGTATNAGQIASAATQVGAFALPSGSADCALLVTLPPGAYSAQVTGMNGSTGIALVEVYQVP